MSIPHVSCTCLVAIAINLALCCSCSRRSDTEGKPKVEIELRFLWSALKKYKNEYGELPVVAPETQEQDNGRVVGVLMASTPEDLVARLNPKRIPFLHVPDSRLRGGAFVDPWNHPYNISFDVKASGKVTVGSQILSTNLAIWSSGPNGVNEYGTGDDLSSWKHL